MTNGVDFTLVPAPEEKPFDELRHLQAKARALRQAAKAVERQQPELAMDIHAGADAGLGVYAHLATMLYTATTKAGPPIVAALGTWLATRAGRKVKIKVGDVEIEASNAKEVQELLDQAQAFKQANEPHP